MAARAVGHVRRNAIAYLALFVALGTGSAYAVDKIGSKQIKRNAVKARHIAPNAVGGSDLSAKALGSKHGLIRTGRISVNDPNVSPGTAVTRTLLKFGPFTLAGSCDRSGPNTLMVSTTLDVAERSWLPGIGAPGRLDPADPPRTIPDGVTGFGAGEQTETAGVFAVGTSGRFVNVAVNQVRLGAGQAHCVFLVSGFGRR